MADGLNKWMGIGNLGRDPEMRYTANGTAMASFSIACSRGYTRDGERVEDTEWVNVVCWQKLAELVAEHLAKGRKVYVEGRLTTRSWEKDGEKRYRKALTEIRQLAAPAGYQSGDATIERVADEALAEEGSKA